MRVYRSWLFAYTVVVAIRHLCRFVPHRKYHAGNGLIKLYQYLKSLWEINMCTISSSQPRSMRQHSKNRIFIIIVIIQYKCYILATNVNWENQILLQLPFWNVIHRAKKLSDPLHAGTWFHLETVNMKYL